MLTSFADRMIYQIHSLDFLGDLQELARREMLDMIERLLLEADLEDQLPKLEVIFTNLLVKPLKHET